MGQFALLQLDGVGHATTSITQVGEALGQAGDLGLKLVQPVFGTASCEFKDVGGVFGHG